MADCDRIPETQRPACASPIEVGLRKAPLLLFFVPALLFADEVYLKGGAKFSGRIESQTDTMVTIDIGSGVVGVAMSRVDHIVKGHSPLDEYDERAKKLGPQDVAGWKSLGHWAAEQGLSAQAREAYGKVVAAAPNDAEARQALGYVQVGGQWLTEEESYRASGYVKYQGEWMTKEEAEREDAAVAAQQAQQDAERQANIDHADAILAESRAQKAQERAEFDARNTSLWDLQVPWGGGGWGFGTTVWPSGSSVPVWPAYQPPQAAQPPQPTQPPPPPPSTPSQ
jgi:hypothetical protein